MHKCLNMNKSLITGLPKKIFSMKVVKVGVYFFFDLAKDQFGQSQAT